ncbi:energy coupling factor transporter S component ThiW [Clostridium estertheticum]|uniref:energy coupling factor transporter S component ThiW n=1 Tax=Clostridium estertheticum TaxID=238834 RepID=UPI001C0DF630|nr:energy coupling factor transporter S component ThiW [Clostridium estertheticum]MBU3185072.1 energy coupling factor transporter S component ThiW [Clostridium estertheticum]MCB2340039.1 energy coupling factor transporter S component ThiW [Clostridium estertheticum]
MKTKKLTVSSLLIAIGVIAGNIIFIPVGVAKCFPVQATINVISAILLGPGYGVAIAFCISLLRNILGTGSLLAFPGSVIGVLLAGILYRKTKMNLLAVGGEIFGTGIIGGILAFPIANIIMGKKVGALFFVAPFLISTIGGSLIAFFILRVLDLKKLVNLSKEVKKG